jgi:hypothetical protein
LAKKAQASNLDLDAAVEADEKMMKSPDDWGTFGRKAFDIINRMLVAAGQPEIDEDSIKSPGEYFDSVVDMVKSLRPTTIKAKFIQAAALMALDYLHKFVHPNHIERESVA